MCYPSANRDRPLTNKCMSIRASAPLFSCGYYHNVYQCPFRLSRNDVLFSFSIHRIIHSGNRPSTHHCCPRNSPANSKQDQRGATYKLFSAAKNTQQLLQMIMMWTEFGARVRQSRMLTNDYQSYLRSHN